MVFGLGKPNIEKMEKKKDIKGLIKALNYDKNIYDYKIRKKALEAIFRVCDDNNRVETLITALSYTSDYNLKLDIIKVIGKTKDPRVIDALKMELKEDNELVRLNAVEALDNINDPLVIGPLVNTLDDEYIDVRRASIEALIKIGDPNTNDALLKSLYSLLSAYDWKHRKYAANTLGNIGDARSVERLIKVLKDENMETRIAASQSLIRIGEPSVMPLIKTLKNNDLKMQREAIKALGTIGDPIAIEALVELLDNKNLEKDTEQALIIIGGPAENILSERERIEKEKIDRERIERRKPKYKAKILLEKLEGDRHYSASGKTKYSPNVDMNDRIQKIKELGLLEEPISIHYLISLIKYGHDSEKIPAAESLIKIYKSGNLSNAQKRVIVTSKDWITQPHDDRHSDHCDRGISINEHTDMGLGLYFNE